MPTLRSQAVVPHKRSGTLQLHVDQIPRDESAFPEWLG